MSLWDVFSKKKAGTKNNKSIRFLDIEGFPTLDWEEDTGGHEFKIPRHFLNVSQVNQIFEASDILQLIVRELTQEIFRNGLDVYPRFAYKCTACGKEYDDERFYCDECGGKLREPNYEDKRVLEQWLKRRNSYGQTMLQVMKHVDRDVEKHDNGFVFLAKTYNFDDEKNLRTVQIDEVLRGSVSWMRKLYSKFGIGRDDEGNYLWTCVAHRDNLETMSDVDDRPRCKECGREMFPAHYVDISRGQKKYYVKGEIYHLMKFEPSTSYGRSRVLAVWPKVMTLIHQDRYMYKMFVLQRSPKGLLLLRGRLETIKKAWAWLRNMARVNPNMVYPLALDVPGGDRASGKMAEYIDLSIDLTVMQFIETREEFRRITGMAWGVSPIYQGDMSQGGGLNNEGLQITVTNRAVADGQSIWGDEGYGAWFDDQLGVMDYFIGPKPAEEKDQKAQIERETMRVQLGTQVKGLGYDIDLYDGPDGLDFIIGEKMEMAQPGMAPMPPGQGGGSPNWGGFRGVGQRGSADRFPGDVTQEGGRRANTQEYEGQPSMPKAPSGPKMPMQKALDPYFAKEIVERVRKETLRKEGIKSRRAVLKRLKAQEEALLEEL